MIRDGTTLLGTDVSAKRDALDRLERQAINPGPFGDYAPIHAWLVRHGRPTGALAALEERTRQGRVPYDFLRLAPDFKALANNARFVRTLAIARAQFDDTVALLREAEARSELPPFMRQPLTDLLRMLGISDQRTSLR